MTLAEIKNQTGVTFSQINRAIKPMTNINVYIYSVNENEKKAIKQKAPQTKTIYVKEIGKEEKIST